MAKRKSKAIQTEVTVVAGIDVIKAVARDLEEIETPERRAIVEKLLNLDKEENESTPRNN